MTVAQCIPKQTARGDTATCGGKRRKRHLLDLLDTQELNFLMMPLPPTPRVVVHKTKITYGVDKKYNETI